MDWMGNTNECIGIIRVSSHKQKSDRSFKETQLNEISKYCELYNLNLIKAWPIIESAKDSERREKLREVEKWADTNKIRHRVYYMADREARNLTDLDTTEKRIKRDEIVIHYAVDRKQLSYLSPDSEFLMRDMQGVSNKQFSRNLSTKALIAMKSKAEDGWFPGNKPPLGYMNEKLKDENGKPLKRGTIIVPDYNQRNIEQVQLEFKLRSQKKSLKEIADTLVSKGYITPKQRRTYEGTIDRRLQNTFYNGYFRWPSDGPKYKAKHKLIINSDIFTTVQKTFKGNKCYSKSKGLFNGGWIKCADIECGCNVIIDPKLKILKNGSIKEYKLYRCTNGKKIHKSFKGRYIHEHEIFDSLAESLDSLQLTKEFSGILTKEINNSFRSIATKIKQDKNYLKQEINNLDNKENNLIDLFTDGLIDKTAYDFKLKSLRNKKVHFTEKLKQLSKAQNSNPLETVKSTIELAKNAKLLWLTRSPEEKLELLKMIVSNPVLDVASIRYDLKKPFKMLAEMNESCGWRSLVEQLRTECAETYIPPIS